MKMNHRDKLKILLVHDGRPHFEVLLAVFDLLKDVHDIFLWSNALNVFGRQDVITKIGIRLHTDARDYDLILLISGDDGFNDKGVAPDIIAMSKRVPTLRLIHAADIVRPDDVMYLFGRAERPLISATTGLETLKKTNENRFRRCRILVQGNIENRRNYALLPVLANQNPNIEIIICGLTVNEQALPQTNIIYHTDLSEIEFHSSCANCDYIMPLIDPGRYSGYFQSRFTSSIQIGLAYNLPFIAHKALFEIYPIHGYPYDRDEDLLSLVREASSISENRYQTLAAAMANAREGILKRNMANFTFVAYNLLNAQDELIESAD
jgi:hypothetical protein